VRGDVLLCAWAYAEWVYVRGRMCGGVLSMCSWLARHVHLCSDDARDNLLQAVRHGELCSPLASHRALRLHASETGGRSDDHSPRLLDRVGAMCGGGRGGYGCSETSSVAHK
jgi:hypothetical protein